MSKASGVKGLTIDRYLSIVGKSRGRNDTRLDIERKAIEEAGELHEKTLRELDEIKDMQHRIENGENVNIDKYRPENDEYLPRADAIVRQAVIKRERNGKPVDNNLLKARKDLNSAMIDRETRRIEQVMRELSDGKSLPDGEFKKVKVRVKKKDGSESIEYRYKNQETGQVITEEQYKRLNEAKVSQIGLEGRKRTDDRLSNEMKKRGLTDKVASKKSDKKPVKSKKDTTGETQAEEGNNKASNKRQKFMIIALVAVISIAVIGLVANAVIKRTKAIEEQSRILNQNYHKGVEYMPEYEVKDKLTPYDDSKDYIAELLSASHENSDSGNFKTENAFGNASYIVDRGAFSFNSEETENTSNTVNIFDAVNGNDVIRVEGRNYKGNEDYDSSIQTSKRIDEYGAMLQSMDETIEGTPYKISVYENDGRRFYVAEYLDSVSMDSYTYTLEVTDDDTEKESLGVMNNILNSAKYVSTYKAENDSTIDLTKDNVIYDEEGNAIENDDTAIGGIKYVKVNNELRPFIDINSKQDFVLGDTKYTLPIMLSRMVDKGWELEEYELDDMIDVNKQYETELYNEEEDASIKVVFGALNVDNAVMINTINSGLSAEEIDKEELESEDNGQVSMSNAIVTQVVVGNDITEYTDILSCAGSYRVGDPVNGEVQQLINDKYISVKKNDSDIITEMSVGISFDWFSMYSTEKKKLQQDYGKIIKFMARQSVDMIDKIAEEKESAETEKPNSDTHEEGDAETEDSVNGVKLEKDEDGSLISTDGKTKLKSNGELAPGPNSQYAGNSQYSNYIAD